MSDLVRALTTDENGCTICPNCNGNKWKAVKNPRLGPGVYEARCDKCKGHGWIEQEHETRP